MKKIKVVNLYKHNIVHKNIKNIDRRHFIVSAVVCFVSIFAFSYLFLVNDFVGASASAFNPISELYRDVEVASFVSSNNVNFIVPIKSEKYQMVDTGIDFEVTSSIMVYAPEAGKIDSIYQDENKKCIKIMHSENLFSIIKNVDIVGIREGENLKQGKQIATAKAGEIVQFSILYNDEIVTGLEINKSFIKWKQN